MDAEEAYTESLRLAEVMELPLKDAWWEFEKMYLLSARREVSNMAAFAQRAGISQKTLYRKMKEHKMDPPGPRRSPFKRRSRMQELAWGKGYRGEEPGPMLPGSEFEVAYNAGAKARKGRGL